LDIDKENIDIDNLTDDDIEIISERLFDPKEMYG
jgi:phosphoribosyl-AMP cyclohydrolase